MSNIFGFVVSSWFLMTALFLVVVISVISLGYCILNEKPRASIIGSTIFVAATGVLWFLCATAFVVQPVTNALLVYSDGTVDTTVYSSGIHGRPLIGSSVLEFPGNENYQWCPEFTPSIQSGVEVKLTVCYRLNAAQVNWRDQYLKWHKDVNGIMDSWRNELAGYVALVTKGASITDLRDNRLQVARDILDKTNAWSETSGVKLESAVLSNWDFTNPDVAKQYDAQVSSSMKTEALVAQQQAAQQERTLQLYQAETYSQVLSARARADKNAMVELGLQQSQWAYYLINQRLMTFIESAKTPNIVVTVGGQGQSPFVYPTNTITNTTP